MDECQCLNQGQSGDKERVKSFPYDRDFSSISISCCTLCGQYWLELANEQESFTASGVWYKMPIEAGEIEAITADNARAKFAGAEWYWSGGSYFGGHVSRSSGKLGIAGYGSLD